MNYPNHQNNVYLPIPGPPPIPNNYKRGDEIEIRDYMPPPPTITRQTDYSDNHDKRLYLLGDSTVFYPPDRDTNVPVGGDAILQNRTDYEHTRRESSIFIEKEIKSILEENKPMFKPEADKSYDDLVRDIKDIVRHKTRVLVAPAPRPFRNENVTIINGHGLVSLRNVVSITVLNSYINPTRMTIYDDNDTWTVDDHVLKIPHNYYNLEELLTVIEECLHAIDSNYSLTYKNKRCVLSHSFKYLYIGSFDPLGFVKSEGMSIKAPKEPSLNPRFAMLYFDTTGMFHLPLDFATVNQRFEFKNPLLKLGQFEMSIDYPSTDWWVDVVFEYTHQKDVVENQSDET